MNNLILKSESKMKKIIFALAILLCSASIFAESKNKKSEVQKTAKAPLDYMISGEYAYYIDKRYNDTFARGFLVAKTEGNSAVVLANVINLTKNERYSLIFTVIYNEKEKLDIINFKPLDEFPKEESVKIMQSVTDFMNHANMRENVDDKLSFDSQSFDDDWQDYKLTYKFSKAVPFFGFTEITFNGDPEKVTTYLQKVGYIKDIGNNMSDFFNEEISEFTEANRNAKNIIPQKKQSQVQLSGGYTALLDKNWKKESVEGNISYWLQVETARDAQITIELLPNGVDLSSEAFQIYFAKNIALLTPGVLAYTIKATLNGSNLVLTYDSYDEQNFVTYTRVEFCKNEIINFSAYKDIYEKNTDYFKNVISSIKKN